MSFLQNPAPGRNATSRHKPDDDANNLGALRRCERASRFGATILQGIGWARVAFVANGRFVFADEALPGDATEFAFIVPADDLGGEIIDVVAWRPGGSPATWLGRAPLLGGRNIYAPRPQLGEFLTVHEGVADWLKADREGVVILNPHQAADWLEGVSLLAAGGRSHAIKLNQMLARPAPSIAFAERRT